MSLSACLQIVIFGLGFILFEVDQRNSCLFFLSYASSVFGIPVQKAETCLPLTLLVLLLPLLFLHSKDGHLLYFLLRLLPGRSVCNVVQHLRRPIPGEHVANIFRLANLQEIHLRAAWLQM